MSDLSILKIWISLFGKDDTTILINGLPLVQIELKRRGIDMKEAFDQIKRYKNHSYNGLYRFIQLL